MVYLLTKDQTIVDNEFLRSIFILIDACITTTVVIVSINVIYSGAMLIFTLIVIFLVYRLNYKFSRVSRRLLAFTTKSRAELMDIYLDTFDNLTMLKSNNREDYFRKQFYETSDAYQLAYTNLYNHSMRWLNMRVAMLNVLIIVMFTTTPLLLRLTPLWGSL